MTITQRSQTQQTNTRSGKRVELWSMKKNYCQLEGKSGVKSSTGSIITAPLDICAVCAVLMIP